MAKYDRLRDHLGSQSGSELTLAFSEVDALVRGLPATARTGRSFWSNDSKVQARAWRAAGWHVAATDLAGQSVCFARGEVDDSGTSDVAAPRPLTTKERHEAMPALCPTCFTAVPGTGVCDYCS